MITEVAQKFIGLIKRSDLKVFYAGEEINRIQVDVFISRIALIYEKIRNAIDYKEDHLLRKNAIQRILWRRLNIQLNSDSLALSLIKELIRAGYIENNLIPEGKIAEIDVMINKYLTLANLSGIKKTTTDGSHDFKWLVSLAACEIEEALVPPIQHVALTGFAYKVMGSEIKIADKIKEEEKHLQIKIAIQRALIKADIAMVSYLIWRYYNPDWHQADHRQILQIAKKFKNLQAAVDQQLSYHLGEKLLRLFKKYTIVFDVLKEIILSKSIIHFK